MNNHSKVDKVIFFGTSAFAIPILQKLCAKSLRPHLVVTTPDRPAGRGGERKSSPVKEVAQELGLEVAQPEKLADEVFYKHLHGADLFVVAAYGKILPADLLRIPKLGSLNVHPSLLPRWRGPSPVQYAILNGDNETGVTIILMDEKVDHGPMLKNLKFEIRNSKLTAPELKERLADLGADLLLEVIPEWVDGEIKPTPQDDRQATFSKILKKEDGKINWQCPAEEIERMVRAFKPWPGTYSFRDKNEGKARLVIEVVELDPESEGIETSEPGTVIEKRGELTVKSGRGLLRILRLKMEGGRSLSGREFLKGHRDIVGAILY